MKLLHPSTLVVPATMSWREFCLRPEIARDELIPLSPAERVVAAHLALGLSNREIAAALGKSEFTVKHQVSSILRKLGQPSRTRLIVALRR